MNPTINFYPDYKKFDLKGLIQHLDIFSKHQGCYTSERHAETVRKCIKCFTRMQDECLTDEQWKSMEGVWKEIAMYSAEHLRKTDSEIVHMFFEIQNKAQKPFNQIPFVWIPILIKIGTEAYVDRAKDLKVVDHARSQHPFRCELNLGDPTLENLESAIILLSNEHHSELKRLMLAFVKKCERAKDQETLQKGFHVFLCGYERFRNQCLLECLLSLTDCQIAIGESMQITFENAYFYADLVRATRILSEMYQNEISERMTAFRVNIQSALIQFIEVELLKKNAPENFSFEIFEKNVMRPGLANREVLDFGSPQVMCVLALYQKFAPQLFQNDSDLSITHYGSFSTIKLKFAANSSQAIELATTLLSTCSLHKITIVSCETGDNCSVRVIQAIFEEKLQTIIEKCKPVNLRAKLSQEIIFLIKDKKLRDRFNEQFPYYSPACAPGFIFHLPDASSEEEARTQTK